MDKKIVVKYKNTGIILLLSVIFALPATFVSAQESVQQNQLKFGRLLRLINGYYVDSVNIEEITEKAIVSVLSELDPHSVYMSKDEVDKMNEPLVGNFEGIGISFNIFKDTLLVLSTISGGPSEKVGLMAGDRIVEVDNKNIAGTGLKNSDVFDLLRGDKGTKVELKVLRKNAPGLLDFTIIRDKIPIFSLDASYMINKTTGLIKLNKFSATTNDEFVEAMKDLKRQNIQNLILDLRGNGGGYLNTAIEISEQFLNNDELVVYTSGLNEPKREYKASSSGEFKKGNLVVLVDESSASASEIVAGAIQDWDRGIIIGRRTFGKGLVQKPYYLTDGSMVRLTTAHYYTPSGRCIQKPYDEGVNEYRKDYEKRILSGEMFNADSIIFSDSIAYKTLLNGRTVHGGGGVMPDIFIPLDTSIHYSYINKLRRNNIIYNFALEYIDQNRNEIKSKYPDFKDFNAKYETTEKMISDIVETGIKDGIEKNEESLLFGKADLKKEIKAIIARDLYSRDDFYKVYYNDDEAVIEALRVIENQKNYNNLLVSTQH
ncbi:MAG TPA: S41 family peptidase [Draconibacterium sp.]|nr:S41 family peptidase [Draconibacterium sp.]